MCGRYVLAADLSKMRRVGGWEFDYDREREMPLYFRPRFNIAPTQQVLAIRMREDRPRAEGVEMRWGLIPSWAKDRKIAASLINARAETVATKPSFRSAFKRRRCLIPADGYYEWQKAGKAKQPYLFRMRDQQPFAFAGLWEAWHAEDGEVVESCTIITTEPNDLAKTVHDRMPVILPPERYDDWLRPTDDAQRLLSLLGPYPADGMEAFRVGTTVNNARNDVPGCLEPVAG